MNDINAEIDRTISLRRKNLYSLNRMKYLTKLGCFASGSGAIGEVFFNDYSQPLVAGILGGVSVACFIASSGYTDECNIASSEIGHLQAHKTLETIQKPSNQ